MTDAMDVEARVDAILDRLMAKDRIYRVGRTDRDAHGEPYPPDAEGFLVGIETAKGRLLTTTPISRGLVTDSTMGAERVADIIYDLAVTCAETMVADKQVRAVGPSEVKDQ